MIKDRIHPNEFENKNLTSAGISEDIVIIGYRAYQNNKIRELLIPNNVKEIHFEAFAGNIIENLKLSENLCVIEKSVFSDNRIKKLDIPEKVRIIERTAFQRNKITELVIPETVREIWTGAFWQNRITKISIGPHVNIINGEYDETRPGGTFGDYGASFLELYENNGFLGGKYTYNVKKEIWDFKEIFLGTNSPIRIWSDELIEYTKDTLSNLEFGGRDGNVRMKRNDGSFGFITLTDALSKKYNVHHDEDEVIDYYSNTSEMIEDGWVLD